MIVAAITAEQPNPTNVSAEEKKRTDPESAAPADGPQPKRVVGAALFLLVLTALIGLALIGLVMLWGRRMRRVARRALPQQSRRDELWYLRRPDQPPQNEISDPDSADQAQAGPNDDNAEKP